eukprot:XP_011431404.1 PREDICTED: uncharacterized protein LOC105331065 [Crassostrea gigas]
MEALRELDLPCGTIIRWPSTVKQLQIAEEVENSCGIPGAVGFIDGTHIRPIHGPDGDYDYYNRKGYPSMQLQMPRRRYWKMIGARKEIRTDKTEETGLMKNSKTMSDLDLTEETGLLKNSKTMYGIRMTEETGLVKNSKTNVDPEEPALSVYKVSDNEYYFFDSHSHDRDGMSACDGKSRRNDDLKTKEKEMGTIARKLKRQSAEIKKGENERETAARKLKRQNVEVKEKERQTNTAGRQVKRQNSERKEKERKMDTASRKLKRQNVEIKEKERKLDTASRKLKRQNVEIREKERKMDAADRKLKRQNVEIKQKERKMDTVSRKLKRQNVEIKEKERKMDSARRRLKRQNVEIKEKERDMDRVARKLKRQDSEIREKEKNMNSAGRKLKRQVGEIKEKERKMNTAHRKSKRQDAEIYEKERKMNTASRKLKRQNVEVQEREKEGNRISKRLCRENPIVLEKERLRKQAKRSNISFRENERMLNREQKQKKRTDVEYCEKANERQRQKRFGVDIKDCIRHFHEQIRYGPIFVCSCCQQTWFKESVSKVENTNLDDYSKRKFLTSTASVDNLEWICNTCYSSMRENKIPKLSVFNGMMWPLKPVELDLFPLEERLVSLRIPFMQIRELPRGGQYSVRGNIVNVPVDIQPTVNSLPRKLDENVTVPVKLKKKLSYQKCDYHENVRPSKVLIALHWLMNNSDFYKNANINIDDKWFQEITTSASEIVRELVQTQVRSNENTDDETVDDDEDEYCEVDGVGKEGNCDTLLDDASRDMNQVYTFAPGEGQRPLSLYQDQTAEYLSFPTIFCGKGRLQDDERQIRVSYADIAKWELRSVDRRAAQSVPNLFFKLKKIQMKQVTDKCNLALRKCKTKGKSMTANEMKNPENVNNLVRHDEGFFVFRQLRNSPAYLETRKKDVFAMIRQLGLPTWFMSLSAADTRWNDLIRALGVLNDGKEYTDEEIDSMTWFEKSKLVQKDPITCSRYFDHRFHNYLECEKNEENDLTNLQVHKHSQTCKKRGKAVCRFGFPLPALEETLILEPLESDVDKYKKMYDDIQKQLNDMKNGCDLPYKELLSTVLKISEEDYIKCIRSSLRGPKVFLKRNLCDMRVNSYNSVVLDAWKANIDIQYILDPYACAMYIVSYISKSQRGMSDLLNRAAKEAREGNLDIKRQVRHIGNHFLNSVEVGAQEAAYLVLQMPMTKASRDVVFINTSPSDDRVILIKTDAELEKLTPNSTDVECSNIIKRYAKRPKQLENWCLADYVSQLDVVFPKDTEKELFENEVNDDEQDNRSDDEDNSDLEFTESDTLVTLRNGIKIKRRKLPRVIRYVRFNIKTDPENYYREKLMLFMPWRNESTDLISGMDTFEKSFHLKKSFLTHKVKEYEFNAEQLDAALQMAIEDFSSAFDELAPDAQQREAEDENEGSLESENFVQFNPERSIEQRQYDIGSDLGIPSTRQITEESSIRLPDNEYLKLLGSLNVKQREFFNHVLQWVKTKTEPVYSFLSGGAGVGKLCTDTYAPQKVKIQMT